MNGASCLRSLLFSLLGLLVVFPIAAQDEISGVFGEVIEVRVVNIEVVVTDQRGQRVTGLSVEDFRLLVDGKEVPIEYFTEIREGEVIGPAVERSDDSPQRPPSLQEAGSVGTSFLVMIDDYFALPRDRDWVLTALKSELPNLGPTDRMAVLAFDGRRLEMLSSWSNSVPALERVIEAAMARPSHGVERVAELHNLESDQNLFPFRPFDQAEFADRSVDETLLSPYERDYARRLSNQLERVVMAATAALRSFAAPPGRKVMLLLSGGWPLQPSVYSTSTLDNPVFDPDAGERVGLFAQLSDTANLLGYTLYPIDLPGATPSLVGAGDSVPPELEAELEDRLARPLEETFLTSASTLEPQIVNAPFREQAIHGSLNFLASETGGRALLNALRDEPFAGVVADTRSYYWLGFSPKRRGDDRRHRIRVEVLRPGLRVRTRKGFLDFSKEREVSMMVESSLLLGTPPSAQPLRVELGPPRRRTGKRMELPVVLGIPMNAVTMLPMEGRYVGQVELRVASLDEDGARSQVPIIPIRLHGDRPPPPGSYARYETRIQLRRKNQRLVLAVYDPPSGGMLSTTVELSP